MKEKENFSNKHFVQMDGFRGLFCLFVFIIHHHFKIINLPISFGYFGMHGFFIISSFLISKSLIEQKKKNISFKDYFAIFYIKRSLRILPVYVFYILFIIFVGIITYKTPFRTILGIVYELKHFGWMLISFTYNFKDLYSLIAENMPNRSHLFAHLWSLSLEEQFYITIPFIVYYISRKNLRRLTILVIMLLPILRIIGYHYLQNMTDNNMIRAFILYHTTFFQYDAFFYGIFIAIFDIKINIKNLKKIFYFFFFLFILSIYLNGYLISIHTNKPFFDIIYSYDFMIKNGQYIYIDILVNILCALLFYISYMSPNSFSFFNNKFLAYIGARLSYSSYVYQYIFLLPTVLYLYPYLINKLHFGVELSESISIFISISSLLIMSNLSYHTFELYFLNKKNDLILKYKKNSK